MLECPIHTCQSILTTSGDQQPAIRAVYHGRQAEGTVATSAIVAADNRDGRGVGDEPLADDFEGID